MVNIISRLFNNENTSPIQLNNDNSSNGGVEDINNYGENESNGIGNIFKNLKSLINLNALSLERDVEDTNINININNEESILKLSYFERISLFIVCILGCYACYSICFIFFPILSLKPKKFSLIWSIGSILFLIAFAILNGPEKFLRHAISVERLPFTVSFVGSIAMTLIFSLVWKHSLLVIVSCIIQAICSLYYTMSYFPYGRQGLRLTTGVARNQVENWLSV